jgi:dTDP-4-dehydrorhamnose reductase
VASWYDFAKTIFEASNLKIKLNANKTEAYPTPAKRPFFSVMDKEKIKSVLEIVTLNWQDGLFRALNKNRQ